VRSNNVTAGGPQGSAVGRAKRALVVCRTGRYPLGAGRWDGAERPTTYPHIKIVRAILMVCPSGEDTSSDLHVKAESDRDQTPIALLDGMEARHDH